MFKKIDHIGIAVKDLKQALALYKNAYGLEPSHLEEMKELGLTMAFIPVGEVLIELMEPKELGVGRIGQLVKEKGEGIDHIAFEVEGLEDILARLKQAGIKLRDEKPRQGAGGSKIAFLDPIHTNSVMTELVEPRVDSKE